MLFDICFIIIIIQISRKHVNILLNISDKLKFIYFPAYSQSVLCFVSLFHIIIHIIFFQNCLLYLSECRDDIRPGGEVCHRTIFTKLYYDYGFRY